MSITSRAASPVVLCFLVGVGSWVALCSCLRPEMDEAPGVTVEGSTGMMNSKCEDSGCKDDWPGLGDEKTWMIHKVRNIPKFIEHLTMLFTEDSVLYIEGTDFDIPEEVQKFMWARRPEKTLDLAPYDPNEPYHGLAYEGPSHSKGFHMSLTQKNVSELAELLRKHGRGRGAYYSDKLFVYKDATPLLESYDVPLDPVYISMDVPEDRIEAFCRAAHCTYGIDEPVTDDDR